MKIGFDVMGGDFAPKEAIDGAIRAQHELKNGERIVLIGDKNQAQTLVSELGGDIADFDFVHTTEVISMEEHPTKAISKKKDSSISIGFKLLASKQIGAFVSAGNTGAMLVGAMFSVKPIEGVIRPCITAIIPKPNGKYGLLLDAGANADCKPDVLCQFGVLGSLMMKYVMGVENPRVGPNAAGHRRGPDRCLGRNLCQATQSPAAGVPESVLQPH